MFPVHTPSILHDAIVGAGSLWPGAAYYDAKTENFNIDGLAFVICSTQTYIMTHVMKRDNDQICFWIKDLYKV